MPIINGMKMACEPCIRGHRSTKCTHAKERLMIPVRKPGRPLSICPHPPGKACGCGGITAAIPRTQKCGCGGSEEASSESPAAATPIAESPSAAKGSTSPTRRTFHVQKSGPKTNGRKQSFDPTNLQRMGPESYNIHPAPVGGLHVRTMSLDNGNGHQHHSTNSPIDFARPIPLNPFSQSPVAVYNGLEYPFQINPDGMPSMESVAIKAATSPTMSFQGANGLSYSQKTTPISNDGENGVLSPDKDHAQINPIAAPAPKSCCSGKTAAASKPAPAPKSCCAGKAAAAKPNGSSNGQPALKSSNGSSVAQFSTAAPPNGLGQITPLATPIMDPFQQPVMQPIFFTPTGDPTVYAYPQFYGTFQHPILPPQWRQSIPQQAMEYGLGTSAQIGGSVGLGFRTDEPTTTPNLGPMSHECTCGDTCNCLACPVHPYNEATKDYVRSAISSMSIADGHHHQPHQADPPQAAAADSIAPHPPSVAAHASASADPSSPPQAQTPSEASVVGEDLSASDYLFVTYPFGCEGEIARCRCGDDCQCVGCMIHSHLREGS